MRRFAVVRSLLAGLVLLGAAVSAAAAELPMVAADKSIPPVRPESPRARIVPTYKVQVGLDGEVYPVFANYASLQKREDRRWGTIAVTITNHTDAPLQNRLAVQVPGWSDREIQMAEMGAGESRTFLFAPSFLPRLYRNREITAATALVEASDLAGRVLFSTTVPVRVRPVQDMYWGKDFKYAQFIASWVTPHDALIESVLGRAKEYMPGRRLPGYERKSEALQERSTYQQARAIYRALQRRGVSYVKSSLSLGPSDGWSERVRTPREALQNNSANCIDGVLLYASLFENLDLDPVVVIVPGHAYVGVRLTRKGKRFLYIETSLTGRASFEKAVEAASKGLARFRPEEITFVRVRDARLAGIYPLPETTSKARR